MKEEADNNKQLTIPLYEAHEWTAATVGVTERFVSKLNSDFKKLKEDEDCDRNEEIFVKPGKKRNKILQGVSQNWMTLRSVLCKTDNL